MSTASAGNENRLAGAHRIENGVACRCHSHCETSNDVLGCFDDLCGLVVMRRLMVLWRWSCLRAKPRVDWEGGDGHGKDNELPCSVQGGSVSSRFHQLCRMQVARKGGYTTFDGGRIEGWMCSYTSRMAGILETLMVARWLTVC